MAALRIICDAFLYLLVAQFFILGWAFVLYQFWPEGINMLWLFDPDAKAYTSYFYYYCSALFLITTFLGMLLGAIEFRKCFQEPHEDMDGGGCGCCQCNSLNSYGPNCDLPGECLLVIFLVALVLFLIMGVFSGVIMFIAYLGKTVQGYYNDVMEQREFLQKFVLDLDTLELDLLDPLLEDKIPERNLRHLVMSYLHG